MTILQKYPSNHLALVRTLHLHQMIIEDLRIYEYLTYCQAEAKRSAR